MRNPLRSEAEAFRFLDRRDRRRARDRRRRVSQHLARRRRRSPRRRGDRLVAEQRARPRRGRTCAEARAEATPDPRHRERVLVGRVLPGRRPSRVRTRGDRIVVVVPALALDGRGADGAVDDRRAEAEETRERGSRRSCTQASARGEIGADDPAPGVEDALRTFGADEIVVVGDEALAAADSRARDASRSAGRCEVSPAGSIRYRTSRDGHAQELVLLARPRRAPSLRARRSGGRAGCPRAPRGSPRGNRPRSASSAGGQERGAGAAYPTPPTARRSPRARRRRRASRLGATVTSRRSAGLVLGDERRRLRVADGSRRHIGSRCSTVTPARRSAPNTCS